MQTSFIIISAILVALISVPFLLINSLGKSGTRKLRSIYKQLADKHQFKTTDKEGWGNSYIGIDGTQNKLIFLKLKGSEVSEEFVNLYLVKGCEIRETTDVIRTNHTRETVLVSIDLIFSFSNGRDLLVFNFYDRESGYQEDYERLRAERWKKIIADAMAFNNIAKKAA